MASSQTNPNVEPACAATVTRLLNQASAGDARAAANLLPLVYDQLRALARQRMRQERAGHTLEGTALVHEAYLRLVDETHVKHWDGRWHFFAAAAEAMRRILVDAARCRSRLKRGGGCQRVDLEKVDVTINDPPHELIAIDEALVKLEQQHPEKAQLVKLRFFAGLTIEEAARALGIAASTADRHWAYARAWLYRQLDEKDSSKKKADS